MLQKPELIQARSATPAPSKSVTDLPCRIGDWQLVSLLGEGTLSRVYRARPADASGSQDSLYAIKVLRDRWQQNAAALDCFVREAKVGRTISHPNLIPVLSVHLNESPAMLVTPYLTGSTIAERLARGQRLGPATALWTARQIAQALAAMHTAGWCHLDVKPSNVMVSATGHVTLIDLGFARKMDETTCIVDRPEVGTLKYIAPELLTSYAIADHRSDIYSLGVVLFEMLVGRLPFSASSAEELVIDHRQTLPKNIRGLAPQLPPGLGRLIRHMLAKDPLRRPQTAASLVQRLVSLEIETLPQRVSA